MFDITLAKKFALMDAKAADKLVPFLIGFKPNVYLRGVEAMEKGGMMRPPTGTEPGLTAISRSD